jgi:hypothetical protein
VACHYSALKTRVGIGAEMDIGKNSAKSTLIQVVLFLITLAALLLFYKDTIVNIYTSGDISKTGLIINGIIFIFFFIGLLRIVMVLFRYIHEHMQLLKMIHSLRQNDDNPTQGLVKTSLAVQRFNSVKWVSQQGAPVNQEAMAASTNAYESSRLTVIRFVHSTLILAGVFGTVVSLSMALIGAAGLLNSPEGVKEMGAIISGMSSALSSTITAIICFFVFAYFYLRLNDARIQLLTQVEDLTSMYLIPKISHTEEGMIQQVAELTSALKDSAHKILAVEEKFIQAGDQLKLAVDDLHGHIKRIGIHDEINDIKGLIRKGFHLSEPEYDIEPKATSTDNGSLLQTENYPESHIDINTKNSNDRK